MSRRCRHQRRGMMYAVAVGAALVVTVVGISALMAVRVERVSANATGTLDAARFLAQSAVESGVWKMNHESGWRSSQANGRWTTDQALGNGTYTLDGVDPIDADLADSKTEPVRLTGTGTLGDAVYIARATAVAAPKPLDALSRALTSNGNLSTLLTVTFLASGAAIHVNGQLSNLAIISANLEVGSISGLGTIIGTVINPAPALEMPDPGVFAMYQGIATTVTYPASDFDRKVLSAGYNPWGAPNPDGVYYIDTGSNDLTIRRSRIHGTLVVKCGSGRKLVIDDPVLWQPYRSDYPALIADCDVEIRLDSLLGSLSERELLFPGTNYNPTGAPYEVTPGQWVTDSDTDDSYADEIQGLVHVKRNLKLSSTTRIRGSVICEGAVTAGAAEIVYTPYWGSKTPMGYSTYTMEISPGSWERVVLP